ncbi:ABC transporter substrate-binding protein [Haloferax sp. Atlit-12N]|uniref:metal ABC transporter substrate-binding protein n=1 Tax=Haloferax sp. Atlit-12N TaxID=2077203 RepID=UPI000E235233|nr:metal ABC transporter substrate-binding protein [Haloferax sp. Atlit-12N]RDZ62059.1 ABC transporter substrate-binding protein [Haloferax sp. Atlit-12N]
MRTKTRRGFLATVTGSAAVGLAGCLGGDDSPDSAGSTDSSTASETTAAASFFVFGDVARHVAGDAASVETLVPIGQHGHGWEPGPDIQGRVLESDLFVHGMPGFQPWADDILTSLEADGSSVAEVDVSTDVELHEIGADGHVHDEESHDETEHHDEETHADETEQHDDESHTNETHHEETEHDDEHTEEHAEEHDDEHGEHDPHFWLDPTRVATATETLRDAFQSVDSANADTYAANAESYRETLSELDAAFEDGLADRERDVLLVAGHNAYGYLADRYDLEIVALTGISPDEEPSPRDIERAQETIAEHGIRHVLADPLESDRAAQQLVSETDAEDVLPLTPLPGVMTEWEENDWGYVDIMREVNLPSLRTALGAQ